jgi:PEP-CTERM motif-containing protein
MNFKGEQMKQILFAITMLALSMPMHADTIFNATGSGTSGTTLTGTVDIDTVSGTMDYAQFYLSNGTSMYGTGGGQDGTEYTVPLIGSDGNSWIFNINASGLAGYNGGSFLVAYPYGDGYFEVIGDLTPGDSVSAAPTPEPGSLVLLATGLIGAGVNLKRRAQVTRTTSRI